MRWLPALLSAFAIQTACGHEESDHRYEKFIPNLDPIHASSYFRVASYNVGYFATIYSIADTLQDLYIDLSQMRVFVVILQEFPLAFTKSVYFAQFMGMMEQFMFTYRCMSFIDDGNHPTGYIVLSRNPLRECKTVSLSAKDVMVHAVVEYKQQNITMLGVHLELLAAAEAERVEEVDQVIAYFNAQGLDTQYTIIGVDTAEQYSANSIWDLRAGLPIEDTFQMLEWTRPSYSQFVGVTRNYMFLTKNMRGMCIGSYALQGQSNSFATLADFWKYPEEQTLPVTYKQIWIV